MRFTTGFPFLVFVNGDFVDLQCRHPRRRKQKAYREGAQRSRFSVGADD